MPKFKTLDVFLYKGHSLTSKLVRFLSSVRYGMPFKDCYSHIALGYDADNTLSAEAGGTKIVPNNIENEKSDVIVYRFNKIIDKKIDKFFQMVPEYLGRGYAFARYAIDAATIFSFVLFIVAIFLGFWSWKLLVIFLGISVLLRLLSYLLKKWDKKTSDCAELSAIFLGKLHLMPYFSSDPRNEFPNSQLTKMEMLRWYKMAQVVGIWDYEKKEWIYEFDETAELNNFPFSNK